METIVLNIDGREIETQKGKTVLEAALEAGIYIPNLCHHPDLQPIGACRLCVVEIEGRQDIPTACTTPAEEGMVVKTNTSGVEQIRRLAAELLLAVHPSDCSTCPKYGKCEFQSLTQLLGVSAGRLRKRHKHAPVNTGNPLFLHDPGRCVLCGRCVRACHGLRGVRVLNYNKQNREIYIGTAMDLSLADAGCKFCGACVEVCPTGALRDHEGLLLTGVTRKEALIPCRTACPAGIDIPRYIRLIRANKPAKALAVIREKVPFPMSLGYVCSHCCETACRRREVNDPVSICNLKRFAAANDDRRWKDKSKQASATGKRVAVVGAGPAGLTAAYYLAKQGHSVTVFEALPFPGGMLRFGIPEYRLPAAVLMEEIKEIESAGVEIRTNTRVDSVVHLLETGYDAVLVAAGSHQGIKLPIPGAGLDGVLVNISFLRDVRLGKKVSVSGKRVVVLGGGNVAFDCARVARRLGAGEVCVACLESREKMPAGLEEIKQGEEEGIVIHPSQTFVKILGDRGRVTGVECLDVKSFAFDENGKAQIDVAEDSKHVLPADIVIFAVGQRPQNMDRFGLTTGRGNTILVDRDTLGTNKEAVFAAGDVATGTKSVIEAVVAGRRAAVAIDKFLGGDGMIDEKLAPVEEPGAWLGREEGFAGLCRSDSCCAPVEQRTNNFDRVDRGYDAETALKEARRCLQCDLRTMITEKKFWALKEKPAGVNSAEALANVSMIMQKGAGWYAGFGTEKSQGTKLLTLAGQVARPGVIEVPAGATLRQIVYEIGGGIPSREFKALQIGGPTGSFFPAGALDLVVDYGALAAGEAVMGSGRITVYDSGACMVDLAKDCLSLIKAESCGKCVLCREGTAQLYAILTDITEGKGRPGDIELLLELCAGIRTGSSCDLGGTAPNPVLTLIKYFRDELEAHIKRKRCPALVCKKYITYHILGDKCQGCGICLRQCPAGAIAGGERLIHVIDQDECTKCGICLEVCPPGYDAVTKAGGVKPKTPGEPIPVGSWKKR